MKKDCDKDYNDSVLKIPTTSVVRPISTRRDPRSEGPSLYPLPSRLLNSPQLLVITLLSSTPLSLGGLTLRTKKCRLVHCVKRNFPVTL